MTSSFHVRVLVYVSIGIWFLVLLLRGVSVSATWLPSIASAATIVTGIVAIFDRWVWKWRFLQGWLVNRPVIMGTWRATVTPTWIDPETEEQYPEIEGYMRVKQTYFSLSMNLYTKSSTSELVSGNIIQKSDGDFEVLCLYKTESNLLMRGKNPIHYGAFRLRVHGDPVSSLSGYYWTDRNSTGKLLLSDRSDVLVTGYAEADEHLGAIAEKSPTVE